ncbi:hypothetical protein GHT06_019079 [Daphnia sinensis]|uniref:Uncharacterized protein n=1 Tax=Daphnia sinensis TaxID=1820382 RepID=A0AAD5L0P8_9CRUS|nr:hypothetical protein GHT06_019079 [Daphnia sinensis]
MSLSSTLWYADPGATQHINKVIYAYGVGDVPIYAIINGNKHKGTIMNVLFMPDIGVSLLSIPSITELGFNVYFQRRDIRITRGREIFMAGKRLGETLYQLDITSQKEIAE